MNMNEKSMVTKLECNARTLKQRICASRAGRHDLVGVVLACLLTLMTPAHARDGVDIGNRSNFSKIVPADQLEQAAAKQYQQLEQQAAAKGVLASPKDPQLERLRFIAQRLIPFTYEWNERARQWQWDVSLIQSSQINAFCMPGGKIAFFSGILQKLKLTDDEVAMVMGHEMAHALREHAREQMGKTVATRGAIELGAALFGLGDGGRLVAGMGGKLLTLKFSRDDESEADLLGMELAARAGYDPHAGVTLWQKMAEANKGAPPQFVSTHPSGPRRIQDIELNLPVVRPIYARATKPTQRFDPAKEPQRSLSGPAPASASG